MSKFNSKEEVVGWCIRRGKCITVQGTYINDKLIRHGESLFSCNKLWTLSDFRELISKANSISGQYIGIDFAGVHMKSLDVFNCSFTDCNFCECDLIYNDLSGTTFTDCLLVGALLDDCNLTNSKFIKCNLDWATIKDCQVDSTLFNHCSLKNTNWSGIEFEHISFIDCVGAVVYNRCAYKMDGGTLVTAHVVHNVISTKDWDTVESLDERTAEAVKSAGMQVPAWLISKEA